MLYPPMGEMTDVVAMVAWWNGHWVNLILIQMLCVGPHPIYEADGICLCFLFRDGSLTLINRASLIALFRFWSSLLTIVKLLMLMLWPEMLQWSNIGEGAFWCSLNLSAKFLADSPMYSSLHPCSLHLNLYMTPLLFVIGSLSLGAMRRFLIVWPPLKNTWTPNLLHDLLILSLSPWWYGTTMYKFVLFFWPVWLVLLVLVLLEFWLLILALFMAHVGYLHLVRALKRCSSSSCNSWSVEHTVDALWNRVPATLYLEGIVWWLPHWRYKSVCIVFLNTDVFRLPSSSGVTRMSRKGMDPSSLVSSQVNCIFGLMEFRCSRKLSLLFFLMNVKVSSTNLFHRTGGVGWCSQGQGSYNK